MCSRTAVNDRPRRSTSARGMGSGPGAADRGRVDERQVRLVEEVVDQHRGVRLHPEDREEHRGDAVAAERHTRMQVRDGCARRLRGEPHQAILLGDLGRAAQRGPLRDGRAVLERRDGHAPAVGGEPPAVVHALQGAVGDLARGQPRPAVRARVGEGREATADTGQGPAQPGEPDRDGLRADLGGQRHGMPEPRERRMRVGEFASSHVTIVAHSRGRGACRRGDYGDGYGRGVLSRWQGGFAAIVVTLLTGVLVILDINDRAMRRWWDGHAHHHRHGVRPARAADHAAGGRPGGQAPAAQRPGPGRGGAGGDRHDPGRAHVDGRSPRRRRRARTPEDRDTADGRVADVHDDAAGCRAGADRRAGCRGRSWSRPRLVGRRDGALAGRDGQVVTVRGRQATPGWTTRCSSSGPRSTPLLQVLDPETQAAVRGDESA